MAYYCDTSFHSVIGMSNKAVFGRDLPPLICYEAMVKLQNSFPSFCIETNEKAGESPIRNPILFINLIPYKYTKNELIYFFFFWICIQRD